MHDRHSCHSPVDLPGTSGRAGPWDDLYRVHADLDESSSLLLNITWADRHYSIHDSGNCKDTLRIQPCVLSPCTQLVSYARDTHRDTEDRGDSRALAGREYIQDDPLLLRGADCSISQCPRPPFIPREIFPRRGASQDSIASLIHSATQRPCFRFSPNKSHFSDSHIGMVRQVSPSPCVPRVRRTEVPFSHRTTNLSRDTASQAPSLSG